MDKEILSWIGNFVNFLIVIYLIRSTLGTGCFNFQQGIITTIGLSVSIVIQLYNVRR